MITYMPADPIPAWPKRSKLGGRPYREYAAERQFFLFVTEEYNASSARMRSLIYRDGQPMICLSCGKPTDARGYLLCGH